MVTKGIIVSVPESSDSNIYKVRLPFFEDPIENAEEMIYESTLNESPGILQGYEVGDVVYCTFEDNNMARPVIIGRLFSTLFENVAAEIETLDLDVTNRASLPKHTTIGNATEDDVARISEIKNKVNKMGDTIFGLMTFGNTIQFTAGKNINLLDSDGQITQTITADDLFGAAGDVSTKVSKSGDTMTGNLAFSDANIGVNRVGRSTNWNKGRDSALVKTTSLNGYSTLSSIKTTNGSWEVGAYNNSSYTDDLLFTYVTDTQYAGSAAVSTAQVKFLENGHIVGNLDGSSSLNVLKTGDTMSGDLNFSANKGINFVTSGKLYWKENNYGDQFAIVPSFSGTDDANLLKIQSAVGAQGTTPDLSDKVTIAGSSGNVNLLTGSLTVTAGNINLSNKNNQLNAVGDIYLNTEGSSSDDSADLVWNYGDGTEKMRIYSPNNPTSKQGPNFRIRKKSDGASTFMYEGQLALASDVLALSGGTVTGTLTAAKNQDASGVADTKPALIIGGTSADQHIEIDGNEILSKSDATTPGKLWLQDSTGSVEIGGSGGLITISGDAGFKCRNISYGTGDPSGGSNGDIYIQYTA